MVTAIVTGVSRGLGESLAAELLARDCHVLGVGRASSARLCGERYRFAACDLRDIEALPGALTAAFEAIARERSDGVCLINNAATIESVGVLGTLEAAGIASSLAVNLVAPVALVNLFLRVLDDEARALRIVNVSSGAAQSTLDGESLYCVAKAGLEMLTRSIAAERAHVLAITLRPGVIDTDMQTFARTQAKERLPSVELFKGFHSQKQLVAPDVVARKVVQRLVLGPVESGRTYSYAEL